jgi:hypothetical protein
VDRFSKFAHFIPLLHPFSAQQVAQAFLDNIYRLHGLPSTIISDRDHIFTSVFWRELFRLAQTTLSISSAYHRKLTARWSASTSVWKHISDASSIRAREDG